MQEKNMEVGPSVRLNEIWGREGSIPLYELNDMLAKDLRVLPKRIILVRHGQSEGNVDETMYCRVPDPQIRLTENGKRQVCRLESIDVLDRFWGKCC